MTKYPHVVGVIISYLLTFRMLHFILGWTAMPHSKLTENDKNTHFPFHLLSFPQTMQTANQSNPLNPSNPRSVRELMECWHTDLDQHRLNGIWKAVPHCLMWCSWRVRNLRTFEVREMDIDELKMLYIRSLFEGMQATRLFSFPFSSFLILVILNLSSSSICLVYLMVFFQ